MMKSETLKHEVLCPWQLAVIASILFKEPFPEEWNSHTVTPKKFSVSSLSTGPFSRESRHFLPNIPPLFQLNALFLAVAVLGMWSQTIDLYVYVHDSLASYRQHLNTIKV